MMAGQTRVRICQNDRFAAASATYAEEYKKQGPLQNNKACTVFVNHKTVQHVVCFSTLVAVHYRG